MARDRVDDERVDDRGDRAEPRAEIRRGTASQLPPGPRSGRRCGMPAQAVVGGDPQAAGHTQRQRARRDRPAQCSDHPDVSGSQARLLTGAFNKVLVMGGNVQDEGTFGIGITQYFNTGQEAITGSPVLSQRPGDLWWQGRTWRNSAGLPGGHCRRSAGAVSAFRLRRRCDARLQSGLNGPQARAASLHVIDGWLASTCPRTGISSTTGMT